MSERTSSGGGWVHVADHGQTGVVGDVADILIATEAAAHQKGWDNEPPALVIVTRHPNGELRPRRRDADPGMGYDLHKFQMTSKQLFEQFVFGLARPVPAITAPPIAYLLVQEGWERTLSPEEMHNDIDVERLSLRGPRLADRPGSREARFGFGVIGSRQLGVQRVRGEDPMFLVTRNGGPQFQWDGGIFRMLRHLQRRDRTERA